MKRKIDVIALIIIIAGAVNWGLIGMFEFDVILWLFGGQVTVGSRIINVIVALAGFWCINLIMIQRKRQKDNEDRDNRNGARVI